VLPRRALVAFLALVLLLAPSTRAQRLDTELEKLIGPPVAWALAQAGGGTEDDPLLLHWVRGIGAQVSAQGAAQGHPLHVSHPEQRHSQCACRAGRLHFRDARPA
jgi:hypothetical protein